MHVSYHYWNHAEPDSLASSADVSMQPNISQTATASIALGVIIVGQTIDTDGMLARRTHKIDEISVPHPHVTAHSRSRVPEILIIRKQQLS